MGDDSKTPDYHSHYSEPDSFVVYPKSGNGYAEASTPSLSYAAPLSGNGGIREPSWSGSRFFIC